MIKLSSSLPGSLTPDSNVVVFSFEKGKRPAGAYLFGSSVEKSLETAIEDGFSGRLGQTIVVRPKDRRVARYIFVGLGPESEADLEHVRRAVSAAARLAASLGLKNLLIRPPHIGESAELAQAATEGAILGTYKFTKYKSVPDSVSKLQSIGFIAKDTAEQKQFSEGLKTGQIVSSAVCFARDLINHPPSDMTPADFVKVARTVAKGPVHLKIFNKQQIEKMGMGGLLGVNRGSSLPPYFLHLIYRPSGKATKRIGICGKGITFDSGGLSLKPAKSMETMKYDMSGAATVLALFKALSELRPSVEVHGFIPLTENMPGGSAVKPGDVLKTYRGKTIEVLNTDAEGRLILADALSYACRQDVDELFDIATLTGACIVALGNQIAGLLGTDPSLMKRFQESAAQCGEKVWELPLEKEYLPLLKSPVADIKNIGPAGEAGTIMAGLFLKEFVDENLPWLHIDIASSAWANAPTPLSDTGSTGVMIRSLLHYLHSQNG